MRNKRGLFCTFMMVAGFILFAVGSNVQAQIYDYNASCDVTNANSEEGEEDGSIDEFDLNYMKDLVSYKLDCSSEADQGSCFFCDVNDDGKCNSKDVAVCKKSLGAVMNFSNVDISGYPTEDGVLATYLSKDQIKARIVDNIYNLNDYPNVNVIDSTWFEGFYKDFKFVYAKRKYLSTVLDWADINSDGKIDKEDRKSVSQYRKNLKKAYGQKVLSDTEVYAKIIEGYMDINDDGSINKLDSGIVIDYYRTLSKYLKGKLSAIAVNTYNYDNGNTVIDKDDLKALKAYLKKLKASYHIYNYDSADVKAKILVNDFDINNDYVINLTDQQVIKDYLKRLNKMKKASADTEDYGDYDINGSGVVDDSDKVIFTRYYVKFKQNLRYGKIKYETPDTVAPILYFKGEGTITIEQGGTYKEPGYAAWDNRQRNLKKAVTVHDGGLDVNVPGSYNLIYEVYDGTYTTRGLRVVVVEGNEVVVDDDQNESYCEFGYTNSNGGREYSKVAYVGDSIDLSVNWNSIGAGNGIVLKSDTLSSINILDLVGPDSNYGCAGQVQAVWYYDDDNKEFLSYDKDIPELFVDLEYMEVGRIYGIQMDGSCTLTAPAGVSFWRADGCEGECNSGSCTLAVKSDIVDNVDDHENYCHQVNPASGSNYYTKVSYVGENNVDLPEGAFVSTSGAGGGLMFKSDTVDKINVEELFGTNSTYGCGGSVDAIWWYDEESDEWKRYLFSVDVLPFLNDLEFIEKGNFYDIRTNQSCTLSYPGLEFWKSEVCEGECSNGSCSLHYYDDSSSDSDDDESVSSDSITLNGHELFGLDELPVDYLNLSGNNKLCIDMKESAKYHVILGMHIQGMTYRVYKSTLGTTNKICRTFQISEPNVQNVGFTTQAKYNFQILKGYYTVPSAIHGDVETVLGLNLDDKSYDLSKSSILLPFVEKYNGVDIYSNASDFHITTVKDVLKVAPDTNYVNKIYIYNEDVSYDENSSATPAGNNHAIPYANLIVLKGNAEKLQASGGIDNYKTMVLHEIAHVHSFWAFTECSPNKDCDDYITLNNGSSVKFSSPASIINHDYSKLSSGYPSWYSMTNSGEYISELVAFVYGVYLRGEKINVEHISSNLKHNIDVLNDRGYFHQDLYAAVNDPESKLSDTSAYRLFSSDFPLEDYTAIPEDDFPNKIYVDDALVYDNGVQRINQVALKDSYEVCIDRNIEYENHEFYSTRFRAFLHQSVNYYSGNGDFVENDQGRWCRTLNKFSNINPLHSIVLFTNNTIDDNSQNWGKGYLGLIGGIKKIVIDLR